MIIFILLFILIILLSILISLYSINIKNYTGGGHKNILKSTSIDTLPTSMDTLPTSMDTLPTSMNTLPTSMDTLSTSMDTLPTSMNTLPTSMDTLPTLMATLPITIFAKANAPLKYKPDESSEVYFHMIKITEENFDNWVEFHTELIRITPEKVKNLSATDRYNAYIYIYAGLDYFKIIKRKEDLYVVYVSQKLNRSNQPPDWRDVECIVSVIATEEASYITQMGIFALAHTYTKEHFLPTGVNKTLRNHLVSIDYKYPRHKHISLYLLAFIGSRINNLYFQKKEALFISPQGEFAELIKSELNKNGLPYGYELESIHRHMINDDNIAPDDGQIILTLYNTRSHEKVLSRDDMKQVAPWYCNIFGLFIEPNPIDTIDCYSAAFSTAPFVYLPISTTEQLSILYNIEDII